MLLVNLDRCEYIDWRKYSSMYEAAGTSEAMQRLMFLIHTTWKANALWVCTNDDSAAEQPRQLILSHQQSYDGHSTATQLSNVELVEFLCKSV